MPRALPRPLCASGLALAATVLAALACAPAWADDYPLDEIERTIPATGKMRCPTVDLVTYRGDVVRYHSPVRVFVGFRDRLTRFEEVVRDTAIEVYGRAPARIRHIGTFNCRRIRAWPTLLSEHAMGNGIDIAGFDFARLGRRDHLPDGVDRALRRSFSVRVQSHWTADRGAGAVHARFLRLLTDRLKARQDIFRVLLGPAYGGHSDHFHFDCAPWRMVVI